MAGNRKDRGKFSDRSASSERPPDVSETAKPVTTDVWVSLLDSSPWSSHGGGRPENPATAPTQLPRPSELPVGASLFDQWSSSVWNSPKSTDDTNAGGNAPIIDVTSEPALVGSAVEEDVAIEAPAEFEAVAEPVVDEVAIEAPAEFESVAEPVVDKVAIEAPAEFESVAEPVVDKVAIEAPAKFEAVAELVADEVAIEAMAAIEPPAEVEAVAEPVVDEVAIEAMAAIEVPTEVEAVAEPVVDEVAIEAVAEVEAPAEVEAVAEPVVDEVAIEAVAEVEAVAEPGVKDEVAAPAPLAALIEEAVMAGAALEREPSTDAEAGNVPEVSPAMAAKPVARAPAKRGREVKAGVVHQNVPVEDLITGIFGVVTDGAKGIYGVGSSLAGATVKGGQAVGSTIVGNVRRLLPGRLGGCASCGPSSCDTGNVKQ
ncbi:magnetosome protein MamJ [Magnetospirillum sp. UT-4]|uniref:magnetosome protein MamJ n=1 Tax=Magnetospirillum sp. UT-4 TaxID=2681467 RepID=UPI00137CCFC7|nr:magnetosome protein MamJ [Magnetospirillum sp. UT-4]CAA7622267.1 Magnetosome protein MamJ [Magnetospirillum sp. UT-4]